MAATVRHLILMAPNKGPEINVGRRKYLAVSPTRQMKFVCGINLMRATDSNEDVRK